ncbi:hypothetical protein FQA39_LY18763 [Lamprigera yunnana]|nr:hypothetical protein FQA39_LY18763 [Lamprigera yunnana]
MDRRCDSAPARSSDSWHSPQSRAAAHPGLRYPPTAGSIGETSVFPCGEGAEAADGGGDQDSQPSSARSPSPPGWLARSWCTVTGMGMPQLPTIAESRSGKGRDTALVVTPSPVRDPDNPCVADPRSSRMIGATNVRLTIVIQRPAYSYGQQNCAPLAGNSLPAWPTRDIWGQPEVSLPPGAPSPDPGGNAAIA